MHGINIVLVVGITLWSGVVPASPPLGTGERLARTAMALVSIAEFGNIGSRDADCRGTPFPVTNVSRLVDDEIAPVLRSLGRADTRSNPKKLDEMISMLKAIPQIQHDGALPIQRLYDQKKQEATVAFGQSGRCASLSSMVQTVMQQRRLELKEISELLSRTK